MNYSTAIFLINDTVRAVSVVYEPDIGGQKLATRTIFKTFDKSIKKDDLVIVPSNTRLNFTVCKVVDVDVDIDLETSAPINWIVGVVDTTGYEKMLGMEQVAIDTIKSAEKNRKREELRKSLMADAESKLMALPISSVNQIEAK